MVRKDMQRLSIFHLLSLILASGKDEVIYSVQYVNLIEGKQVKMSVFGSINLAGIILAVVAIVISIIALIPALRDASPGVVQTPEASGYGFIRGIDQFPSDHIVLPLVWENTGGQPVYLRHPYLILHESGPEGKQTEYCFFMTGEYSGISTKVFKEGHTISDSFSIYPHSTEKRVLLFSIKDFYNESSPAYNFTFAGGKNYSVKIGYYYSTYTGLLHCKKEHEVCVTLFDKLKIPETLDVLSSNRSKKFWDYVCTFDLRTCETKLNNTEEL
jgi:hypothetical protein